jgi:hypothetical protein
MPTYVITAPDGHEYEVTVPENATQEEVLNYAKQNYQAASTPKQAEAKGSRSVVDELARQVGLTARAGITGVASIPTMLAEPVTAGINALAGKQVLKSPGASLQEVLTQVGLPEPENKLERAVQAGTSAMAGAGSQAAAATRSGIQALQPLTREQVAAAGASGTAAQATSESMEESGVTGLPNLAATLASGTLAGLAGAKAVRVGTTPKAPNVTIEDVRRDAGRAYNRVDQAGVVVRPNVATTMVDDIESRLLRTANFNPEMDSHKPVQQLLDQMRKMVPSSGASFSRLDQLRQAAGDMVRDSKDAATRRLARMVLEGVDDRITRLQPQDLSAGGGNLQGALSDIRQAREAWKRTAKASMLEDALNVAEARALAPQASEGELIRTQFKAIAANKDKMRLFSPDEQTAIRKLVSGSGSQTLLAMVARLNPERSQLMAGAQIAGAFTNPVASLATAATGFSADKLLGRIQSKAARDTIAGILTGIIRAPRSTQEAALRALVEAGKTPVSEDKEKPKTKKTVTTGETITIDGVEIPVDSLGLVTGRDTPTLPESFFRNEAAMRRAME